VSPFGADFCADFFQASRLASETAGHVFAADRFFSELTKHS